MARLVARHEASGLITRAEFFVDVDVKSWLTAGMSDRTWFETVRSLALGRRFGEGSFTVEFRCIADVDEFHHHQVHTAGTLTAWNPGPAAAPDLILRQPLAEHRQMLARVERGNALLEATQLIDPVTGRVEVPPPLDEVHTPWGRDLPEIPTAPTFRVQQVLAGSPFGDVAVGYTIERGQVARVESVVLPECDVFVLRTFALALGERSGAVDLMQSLEGGQVAGDLPTITMFLGGYESDECVEARLQLSRPSHLPLVALGTVLSSPAWAEIAEQLTESQRDVEILA